MRRARLAAVSLALVLSALLISFPASGASARTRTATVLFADGFGGSDRLITNEYAYWNPQATDAVRSPRWDVTSGSFFVQDRAGWTGVPDDVASNATSSNGTHSAVFRLVTKRADFGDVAVSVKVLNQRFVTTPSTSPQAWDGVHVWVRYQSEYLLYVASVNRRDNTVAIKKKVPGGTSNGGTYYTLASAPHAVPTQSWQHVRTTVRNNADGSVTISLSVEGALVVQATDTGVGGPPITSPGKVGVRGDNDEFKIDRFVVSTA